MFLSLQKELGGKKTPNSFKYLQSIWTADNGGTKFPPSMKSPRKENMGKPDLWIYRLKPY